MEDRTPSFQKRGKSLSHTHSRDKRHSYFAIVFALNMFFGQGGLQEPKLNSQRKNSRWRTALGRNIIYPILTFCIPFRHNDL